MIHESSFVKSKNYFGTLPDSGHELMYKRLRFLDDFDLQKNIIPPGIYPPSDPEVRIAEETVQLPSK